MFSIDSAYDLKFEDFAIDAVSYTHLSQRPNDKMSDEQLEQLAPWSETAKVNCQN